MFCAHLLPCTTVIGWMKCFSFLWKDWFVGIQGIHHCIEKQQSWLFLMCVCLVTPSRPTLRDPMDCSSPGSSVHGESPSKNTRVGCHALLQGIFPTQGSKPGLPHCRQILYCLSHQGSPGNMWSDIFQSIIFNATHLLPCGLYLHAFICTPLLWSHVVCGSFFSSFQTLTSLLLIRDILPVGMPS